jgi:predicted dinucleotide-binding enzyme
MFVCGDDEAVKPAILKLGTDVGFDAVDAGKLVNARLLEPWAMQGTAGVGRPRPPPRWTKCGWRPLAVLRR